MSDTHDLEQLAEQIMTAGEQQPSTPSAIERAQADGARLTSGMERGGEPVRYDPATFMEKPDRDAPALLPSARRGSGSHAPFVHSAAVSRWHSEAREAACVGSLPASHAVVPTKKMKAAWAAVQDAWAAAAEIVTSIPRRVAEATAERSRLAGQGDQPVTLPSPQDVRAHWDAKAIAACRVVVEARADYDRVIAAEHEAHTAALGQSIPGMAASVLDRVRDLEGAVRDLRTGVSAYVDVAGNASPDVMPARMPGAATLSVLADLEREVEELQAVAEQPSQPRISPSLAERSAIMRRSQQAVNGLTVEVLDLARRERAEGYAHTAHTKAIPDSVLASFAQSQASFLI